MKFIHISDVNLGIKPDRGRPWSDVRATEIEESFQDLLNICEEEKIELLLIAGNLFHEPITKSKLKALDIKLRNLTVTRTVIIAGSNDYMEEGSDAEGFEFESNTVLFPRERAVNAYFEDLNICVTGYSYGKPEYSSRILEKLKPGREGAYNIMLGHGGDKEHMPFSKERIANLGFQYVALGHITKPSNVVKNQVAFSGSLEPLSYKDTGKRGYILGEVESDGTTKISLVQHSKRTYLNLSFELTSAVTQSDLKKMIVDKIEEEGVENIYRIQLTGKVSSELEINISSLGRTYNIYEIIDKTEADYDMDELLIDNDNNLLGAFVRQLTDENSSEKEEIRNQALKYGLDAILDSIRGR